MSVNPSNNANDTIDFGKSAKKSSDEDLHLELPSEEGPEAQRERQKRKKKLEEAKEYLRSKEIGLMSNRESVRRSGNRDLVWSFNRAKRTFIKSTTILYAREHFILCPGAGNQAA